MMPYFTYVVAHVAGRSAEKGKLDDETRRLVNEPNDVE